MRTSVKIVYAHKTITAKGLFVAKSIKSKNPQAKKRIEITSNINAGRYFLFFK